MKEYHLHVKYIALVILAVLLCGCQKNPARDIVTSKNDGTFDASLARPATDKNENQESQSVEYTEIFMSSDGSVEFKFMISEKLANENWPIIEVSPHYLTETDAERVARILFKDADFFYAEPRLAEKYTKSELQNKIMRWAQYSNVDALHELFGDVGGDLQFRENLVKAAIEEYTEEISTSNDDYRHAPCQWQYKKESFYWYNAAEIDEKSLAKENDVIQASVKIGDISYIYTVSTRNQNDFKINNIHVYPFDGFSPNSIDDRIFRAWLCRTEEPTDEQVELIRSKCESMIAEMQLGTWMIDECYVDVVYYGEIPEFVVCINAVPMFDGIATLRRPQITNLKSEEAYASNYYLSDIRFEFSANGNLVRFSLYSPLDVVNTVNKNVAVLENDQLLEIAREHLKLSDYYQYGYGAMIDLIEEEVMCTVDITNVDMKLTRVKVPNTDERYYYIPSIAFMGQVEYYGKESGKIYFSNEDVTLVILNAVDGSIINPGNE